jgi:hypothetical protein
VKDRRTIPSGTSTSTTKILPKSSGEEGCSDGIAARVQQQASGSWTISITIPFDYETGDGSAAGQEVCGCLAGKE